MAKFSLLFGIFLFWFCGTVKCQPTITLGLDPIACVGDTNTLLTYTATLGNPIFYSIRWNDTAKMHGFSNTPLYMTTVAGNGPSGYSGNDGNAIKAGFADITGGIAFDVAGNILIADNNGTIRKVNGAGIITTIAGIGVFSGYSGDSIATNEGLSYPYGIATDISGNFYIADYQSNSVLKVNSSGIITHITGHGEIGYSGDGGPATAAKINITSSGGFSNIPFQLLAVDVSGNIYISDFGNNVIRKINTLGIITTFAGNGIGGYSGDGGPAVAAQLGFATAITTDGSGNLYIADNGNSIIRKVNTVGIISTVAGSYGAAGAGDNGDGGAATDAAISGPVGVAVDGIGNLYISDNALVIRKVNTSGIISTIAGNGTWGYSGDGANATAAQITSCGLALDISGILYLADKQNNVIRKISADGIITTVAGNGGYLYSRNGDGGAAIQAQLNNPTSVAADDSGNIFISDFGDDVIRKVNKFGIISTVAGNGTGGYAGNNGAAILAQLDLPVAVVLDNAGNLYIADRDNYMIRKVSTSGIITTVAGTGIEGYSADGGSATNAKIYAPTGITIDHSGNLYFSENARIRKVTTSGIISTIAGNGVFAYSGDGGAATSAEIEYVRGLASDNANNLYLTQSNTIRKISPSGNISKIAGSGTSGYSGDNGDALSAEFVTPSGVSVDSAGNVYIADLSYNNVRKVNTAGIISTVVGNSSWYYGAGYGGYATYSKEGGVATAAQLGGPWSASMDHFGNLYIADAANNVIRKVNDHDPLTSSPINIPIPSTITTGIYTGILTVYDSIGANTSYAINVHVSNHPPDPGIITGLSSVCEDAVTPLHNTVINGEWTSGNTSVATIDSFTGMLTGISSGIVAISYATGNGCGTGAVTKEITVNPLPFAGVITGLPTVCETATINLTNTITGGSWNVTNIHAAITGGILTGLISGIDTIYYSVTNVCGTATTSKTVTVNPLPVAAIITGVSNVCATSSITLMASIPGGTWSHYTGAAVISGGVVTGISTGIDTIGYNISNVCGIAIATKIITINPLPFAGVISGASNVCVGAIITLSDTVTGGVWDAANGFATVSSDTITGLFAGIDTFSYVVSNLCGIAVATKIVSVEPLPVVGVITGDSEVCLSSVLLLTNSVSGGIWSGDTTKVTVTAGAVTGIATGTAVISYAFTNLCGTAIVSKNVTVFAPPVAGIITGLSAVCPDSIITLTDTVIGGVWSSVNIFALVDGSGNVTGVSTGPDAIIYTVTNTCGADETVFPIEVLPLGTCTPTDVDHTMNTKAILQIYPNPNSGEFTLRLLSVSKEDVYISILNVIGEKIKSRNISTNKEVKIKLDVSPGIYFLTADMVGERHMMTMTVE